MTEENKPIEPQLPPQEDSDPIATVVIRYNIATGETQFQGPIGNKTLCYGMLKTAEKLIDGHMGAQQRKEAQGMIGKILGMTNGGKGLRTPGN